MHIEKISVSMSQKINLGGYETRDFYVGIEGTPQDGYTFEREVELAREMCAKEVGEYYKRIKGELLGLKKDGTKIPDDKLELLAKIENAKTSEELEALRDSVKAVTDKEEQAIVFKVFNETKIKLSNAAKSD